MSSYSPPLDRLLSHGWDDGERLLKSRFQLTTEHIPELVRLATDRDLWLNWSEPESIGTCLALQALTELGAIDQVPRILDFVCELDRTYSAGDWATEEMGDFLAAFGPDIVPLLKAELARRDRTIWMLSATAKALELLARDRPGLRTEAVAAISGELARRDFVDPELNSLYLSHLLDLKATEAAPIIEQGFAEGQIDERMCGDWPEVRHELGLGPMPPRRKNRQTFQSVRHERTDFTLNPKERAEQRKAKRKAAKRARKRNRSQR